MKTNNRIFIHLRYVLFLLLMIEIILYNITTREIFLYCSIIVLILCYKISQYMIKKLYKDVRLVIQSFHQEQDFVIEDGDLGILYHEIRQLQRRGQQYEETINQEKQKLRETIEDICHQIKTPLTSIGIYNELLKEEYHQDYVYEIDEQIEKMKYLINTLLTIAKIESNQIQFDYQNLPIHNAIELSLQSLHSLIEKTKVKIKIDDCPCCFYYDESWLQEAFMNIFKNNIEHGCSYIHISFMQSENYVKVIIYNDGPEIESKDLPHIFERFYHTKHQQGVGIGLSLTQEIIHRHHGTIHVYNQDGVIFEIMFPFYQINEKYKLS